MNQVKLRAIVGFGLVASHFSIILLVGVLTAVDRFTQNEMLIVFGIVAPMFAAYTTLVVKAFLDPLPTTDAAATENAARSIISIATVVMFSMVVILAILWKAFSALTFDGLVKLVAAIETLLGAYVGAVVQSLFGPIGQRPAGPEVKS